MTIERNVLVSVLALTEKGEATLQEISEEAGAIFGAVQGIIQKYSEASLYELRENSVFIDGRGRVQLATKLLELGADLRSVCDLLSWKEFEDIAVEVLQASGFSVIKHFRFKEADRGWEVDVLGLKRPLIISVDCKHWRRGWQRSAIRRVVELQNMRTKALSEASTFLKGKLGILGWEKATFIPAILSLIPGPFRLFKKTPIVPVFQIRDFLNGIEAHLDSLTHFTKTLDFAIED